MPRAIKSCFSFACAAAARRFTVLSLVLFEDVARELVSRATEA
jgi:hypothetical protein